MFDRTFIDELIEERYIGKEEEVGEHLTLNLRMDLVLLEEVGCRLKHAHQPSHGLWHHTHGTHAGAHSSATLLG